MGAERRALAMAVVAAGLMISGAAVAAMPNSPPQLAAYASVVRPSVTVSATTPPPINPNLGVPHPIVVVPTPSSTLHAAHVHHVAVIAATTAPAPTHSAVVTTSAPAPAPTTPSPTTTTPSPTPTHTTQSPPAPSGSVGASLLSKALTMQGVPYVYGGDSPSGFDCSGLVYWAALQLGISSMPRDTFEMLAAGVASGLLVQTSNPSYGDLAFFGSGHVEFYVHAGETFGAQNYGTLVGYHPYGGGYAPTMFFRVT